MILPPRMLLDMYCNGRFPMADGRGGEIFIYDPDPRGIIDLDAFHIPGSLHKTIRSRRFAIRVNTAFEQVIHACSERDSTWISEDIIASYLNLYRLGYAHSVEAWSGEVLAGGLYGVSIGGAFFGESMFTRFRDASKVALAALVERMGKQGMTLLDTQYTTPHLERFGAMEVTREEYLRRLRSALALPVRFYP